MNRSRETKDSPPDATAPPTIPVRAPEMVPGSSRPANSLIAEQSSSRDEGKIILRGSPGSQDGLVMQVAGVEEAMRLGSSRAGHVKPKTPFFLEPRPRRAGL